VGATPISYRNLCQKREYKRWRVVCSMPPFIPVHPVPVIKSLLEGKGLVIVGDHISEEVTRRSLPIGALCPSHSQPFAAFRAGSFNPVSHLGKR
jgi:hypothetical protein